MDSITLSIGLGLGFLVLVLKRQPALLKKDITNLDELPRTHDVLLALMALGGYLVLWATDLPKLFGFLAEIPWIVVPLGFLIWYAIKKGAKWMIGKLLFALFLTSMVKIAGATHTACFQGYARESCPLPAAVTDAFRSSPTQVTQAGGTLSEANPISKPHDILVTETGSDTVETPESYVEDWATTDVHGEVPFEVIYFRRNGTTITQVHKPDGPTRMPVIHEFIKAVAFRSLGKSFHVRVCVHRQGATCTN